ncbi:hypothetical protein DUNSADRAFT_7956 [Dunaliella salina]|uniref:Uncharacterized protein n=1 Tax=Dunaliella salina TaxID=3046 RepID=A0ABQ7H608_DUNSA|nr:hypothetical protein DUNSADRAFT_7956 [Dunaliella salina]|eukprot:KAF5842303.1 hypothetical protein DUNSADRAFT_7956 [Dunaliella salina]
MMHAKHLNATSQHVYLPALGRHQRRANPHISRKHSPSQLGCIVTRAATQNDSTGFSCSKRALLFGIALLHGEPAVASEFGNSLAKIWRDRQKANIDIYLAPIRLSIKKLADASALLQESTSGTVYMEVLQIVRGSSLNCYLFDPTTDDSIETRASLATQQYKFGNADTCTFRLIVKNVTGLLPDEKRREGEKLVEAIVMSFQKVDGQLEEATNGDDDVRQRAKDQLAITLSLVRQLEAYVSEVLS